MITNPSNNPPKGSGGDESDLCEPVGGCAIEGIRLRPPTGGAGDGHDGAEGAAAGIGLDPLEHVGGGRSVVLCSGTIVACTTPSMPWHLIEDPAVHILGLIILTLFR